MEGIGEGQSGAGKSSSYIGPGWSSHGVTSSVGPVAVERIDRTDTEVALEGDRADRTAEGGGEEDTL